jgi:hypothetical protein
MNALLTTMQGRPTLRASSSEISIGRERYSTVKAARRHYVLNQSWQLRSCDINGQSRALLLRAVRAVRPRPAVRILVSVLPVFAIAVHLVDRLLRKSRRGAAIDNFGVA